MSLKEQYMEMTGANRFLLEHVGETLEENRREIQGISHSVNLCNAGYADVSEAQMELRERVTSQAQELREANAAIGKLQGDATTMEESLQKAREAFTELKKTIAKGT